MKKALVLILVLAGACLLVSCSPEGDKAATASADRFVLGLDDAFPPMGFRNENNEIVGYDIDLAREVCRRLGRELVLQPIDWNAKEMELNTRKIDCIWNGFTITPERAEAMTFTPPYLRNAQVLVVRTDSGFKSLTDLAGKKVATQAGSSGKTAIDEAPEFKASLAEVVEVKDYLTALMDLEARGVDAVVMDLLVANDNIHRSGKTGFAILDESLSPESYGVGFRKGDTELMQQVWSALEAMAADGTIAPIAKKWFGEDISIIGK